MYEFFTSLERESAPEQADILFQLSKLLFVTTQYLPTQHYPPKPVMGIYMFLGILELRKIVHNNKSLFHISPIKSYNATQFYEHKVSIGKLYII